MIVDRSVEGTFGLQNTFTAAIFYWWFYGFLLIAAGRCSCNASVTGRACILKNRIWNGVYRIFFKTTSLFFFEVVFLNRIDMLQMLFRWDFAF